MQILGCCSCFAFMAARHALCIVLAIPRVLLWHIESHHILKLMLLYSCFAFVRNKPIVVEIVSRLSSTAITSSSVSFTPTSTNPFPPVEAEIISQLQVKLSELRAVRDGQKPQSYNQGGVDACDSVSILSDYLAGNKDKGVIGEGAIRKLSKEQLGIMFSAFVKHACQRTQ